MKLIHFFWSLLILAFVIFIPGLFYRTNGKLHGGQDLFALYLLLLAITTIVSPAMLLLCKASLIKKDTSFIFTLLLVFNLYFGTYGIYMTLTGEILHSLSLAILLFSLNILWALLIILYVIGKTQKKQRQ